MAISQKDFILREIDDNSRTKKYNNYKIVLMKGVIKDLEIYIEEKKELLVELKKAEKTLDPNSYFLERRLNLAQKHHSWRELFDCNNEPETSELLGSLYDSGIDKFVKEVERLGA